MDEDEDIKESGFRMGGDDDDEALDLDAPADIDFGLDEEDPDKDS